MITKAIYTRLKRIFELHQHPRLLIEDSFSPQLNNGWIEDVYRHYNYTNPFKTDSSYCEAVVSLYHRQFDTFCDIVDLNGEKGSKRSSFSLRIDDVHFTSTFSYNLSKIIRETSEDDEWMDEGYKSSVWLEYLKEYGVGFFDGFNSFDDFINNKVGNLGEEARARRIFQFATNNWAQIHEPIIGTYGVPVNAEDTGKEYGMRYKAWSRILANQEVFENLAKDYWEEVNSDFEPDPIGAQEIDSIIIDDGCEKSINFGFDQHDENDIKVVDILYNGLRGALLNDNVSIDHFRKVMYSKNLPVDTTLKMQCYNYDFAIFIDALSDSHFKGVFKNFNLKTIGHSKSFTNRNKNGAALSEENLRKSKENHLKNSVPSEVGKKAANDILNKLSQLKASKSN